MKKVLTALSTVFLITVTVLCFIFPINDGINKTRLGDGALYANNYVDYAKDVKFDLVKYPELEDQGFYWVTYDEKTKTIKEIKADTKEGAALVDADKPTIINVHGVKLNDGYRRKESYIANPDIARPSEFGMQDQNVVNMNYIYLKAGYNVANYHYNKFADEHSVIEAPKIIEGKVWGTNGQQGMRFRHDSSSPKYSDKKVSEYSVAEHFVADYLRAMNMLDEKMGSSGIHLTGHSMGGEVVTAFAFLLTELIGLDMIPSRYMPERLSLLDPYFGVKLDIGNGLLDFMSNSNLIIRWSGKTVVKGSVGATMIDCLKDIKEAGTVIEYVTNNGSFLNIAAQEYLPELKKLCVYTTIVNNYPDKGYVQTTNGHDGVREWYLLSKLYKEPKLNTGGIVPSASTDLEKLREFVGREFYQIEDGGNKTLTVIDDTFKEILR